MDQSKEERQMLIGKKLYNAICRFDHDNAAREEYYRIIHTAYLRANGNSCIDVIRTDFENCFGITPDNISISYIYATTKYLVYDVVVSSLLSDGKIDSQ